MGVYSTVLSANIRQDRTNRPVTFLVERQHVIVLYGYFHLGLLGGVKETKGYLVQQGVRQPAERARQEIDYGQGGKGYTFDALKPIDVQLLPKRFEPFGEELCGFSGESGQLAAQGCVLDTPIQWKALYSN